MNVQNATSFSLQQSTGNRPALLRARDETQVHTVSDITQLELKTKTKSKVEVFS